MWPLGLTLAMTLTLNFHGKIWNLLYLNKKWSYCHETKSNYYWLNFRPQMWPSDDLGHDLDLEFSRSNMEFAISQPKVVRLPRNEKQIYRLNSKPQMWPMGLTLTFEFSRSNVTFTFDHTWPWPWIAVSQNGRADWHWTKGVGAGYSWPSPWPFGDQGQV